MTPAIEPRHAVYFAPDPAHPLWEAGCRWLGRDARSGSAGSPARPEVASPWRYGWHATLSAPARLGPGIDEQDWLSAVRGIAGRHRGFTMPVLKVGALPGFLALRLVEPIDDRHPLRRLADDCVRSLAPLAAPLRPEERKRRQPAALTPRQHEQLERFGQACVLDDWRFHMTLTGNLADLTPEEVRCVRDDAIDHFSAALSVPMRLDAICVFVEPSPSMPLELRQRLHLSAD